MMWAEPTISLDYKATRGTSNVLVLVIQKPEHYVNSQHGCRHCVYVTGPI